jgi:hypothetical protein
MSSRKKKNKRKQKKRPRAGKGRPRHPALPPGAVVIHSPPGEVKMSEVLLEFLEPYSEYWANEDSMRKLITVGMIAWNAALFSGPKRTSFIDDMVQQVPPDVRSDMRAILDEMIQRKETHFGGIKRAIISYELGMTPAGPHLSVMSSMEPPGP